MICFDRGKLLRSLALGPCGAVALWFGLTAAPASAQVAEVSSVPVEEEALLVAWRSVEDGEEEARATGRLALYFFTADWCAPCHTMKREVFSQPAVFELIQKHYVPIEVLDRTREEGKNSASVDRVQFRFLVDAFPTLVVARPDRGHGITEAGMLNEQGMERLLRQSPAELERLNRGR